MSIVWLASALDDLRHLRHYIAEHDRGSATVAVGRIRARVESLELFPNQGRLTHRGDASELMVPRTPYIVVYRVLGDDCEIIAIRHGARDWSS